MSGKRKQAKKAPRRKAKNAHVELARERAEDERCKVRVRCLGLDPAHTFLTASASERICGACRSRIDERLKGVSPQHYRPVASVEV